MGQKRSTGLKIIFLGGEKWEIPSKMGDLAELGLGMADLDRSKGVLGPSQQCNGHCDCQSDRMDQVWPTNTCENSANGMSKEGQKESFLCKLRCLQDRN